MARILYVAAIAAGLVGLTAAPVRGEDKPGKNQAAEEAAKWVEAAGDRFTLTLYGPDTAVVFTTDKKAGEAKAPPKVFVVTKEEAAAIVRVLVDCGMWNRPDTLPEISIGRFLAVGRSDEPTSRIWRLGEVSDDVSSLVVVRHLLQSSKGDRRRALTDWLADGSGKKAK